MHISRPADDTAISNHAINSYALRSERLTETQYQLRFDNKKRFRRGRENHQNTVPVHILSAVLYMPNAFVEPTNSSLLKGWDPYSGHRIGEAKNPGPGNQTQSLTCVVLNPTVLTERHSDILALNADVISLVETSATSTIQTEFTQFLRTTNYQVAWSPPVAPQKTSVNTLANQISRRGEALGTASLHRTPHRASRNELPTWLKDTLRVSQRVILLGHVEVLLVSAYFYAGRTFEVKQKSDMLLATCRTVSTLCFQ